MTTVQSDPAVPFGAAPGLGARVRREVGPLVRPYELMVILDAGLEEDAIRSVIDRTTELVRSRGGNVTSTDRWGRRRFAYELKHRWEGYYVLLRFEAEAPVIAELDRFLHLADEVLRHKVVRLPEKLAGAALSTTAPGASKEANGA